MTNDQKILNLKAQIASKQQAIAKAKKFSPVTNCVIELDDKKYNLQVLTADQLTFLAVRLNSYQMSAFDLCITEPIMISGFAISDWVGDILAKKASISQKQEESKLTAMEKKLTALLSEDKKTELELDEIAKMLQ